METVPNFKAFNFALGDGNIIKADMHRNNFTPSSSLLEMADLHKQAFPFTAEESCETVEVRRLDDIMADISLIDNILIKIDVQGYEDKVIRGGEKLIGRAKVLIIEASFHKLYEGQPLFDEIYSSLREIGFRYIGNLTQLHHPVDGRVLQADLILTQ
jgi:FkbM family methyltransferase